MKKKLFAFFALLCNIVAYAGGEIHDVKVMTDDESIRMRLVIPDRSRLSTLSAKIYDSGDSEVLWQGAIGGKGVFENDSTYVLEIEGLTPRLWSPANPVLYSLELTSGEEKLNFKIGFRRFEMKDGSFFLNGKKIFLRGNAINPPNRGIPTELEESMEFARDYVRFLKHLNINFIRIPINQNWMQVCDEEGMMVFGGRYGRPHGGSEKNPPLDFDEAIRIYKEQDLGSYTNHPSVMVYSLSNEMPTTGKVGEAYMDFLHKAYEELRQWDDTREYIGNAGYGMGKAASIYDVHRYWGWYYNSFLTFLNIRDMEAWQNEGRIQAITFSECVGNYTGVDGRYNLCSRTKQPGSQKCWTGHLDEDKQADAALRYQAFVLKNVTEMFRRFRSKNPRLSGVLPFTIIFYDWDGVKGFGQMKPKPVAYQYQKSYQPVLLSLENWNYNAKAGRKIKVFTHIVNDDDNFQDLGKSGIRWRLESLNRHEILSGTIAVEGVPYYGTWSCPLELQLPENLTPGVYTLKAAIITEDGDIVSENDTRIRVSDGICPSSLSLPRKVWIYGDDTFDAVRSMAIKAGKYRLNSKLNPSKDILVIGENAADEAVKAAALKFSSRGGRVVCMGQSSENGYSWIDPEIKPLNLSNNDPTYLSPSYMYVDGMCINIEDRESPVFRGISSDDIFLWGDCTSFDESLDGFPRIYPVCYGFNAGKLDRGQARIIANYGRNLASTAMAEIAHGKGSILVEGFDIVSHCGVDPVAERLLANILSYACNEKEFDSYPSVGNVIEWGSYSSEKGLVTGAGNGLVLNPYPVVPLNRTEEYPLKVDSRGYHYVVSYGGWNTRPGVQYLPRGRRPFAPYDFTPGGNDTVAAEAEKSGEGYFVARVPSGCTRMSTTFENNTTVPLEVGVSINGGTLKTVTVPPESSDVISCDLPSDGRIRVLFKGDRRIVILKTEFR